MDENTKSKLLESRTWIREELERCIGFWLNNGMDPVNGGVYTCLDREGKVFSTDKSVWMQRSMMSPSCFLPTWKLIS